MTIIERKQKLLDEVKKIEEKEDQLKKKKKELKIKIEEVNKEIVDQNNQKILDVIHESFGEVTPANIEEFKKILKVNQYKEVEKEDQEKYNYENYSS